jgi:hypothetical protein
MNRALSLALSTLATLLAVQAASSQQAPENQAQGPGAVPIEIYGCTLRDGMSLADLEPMHDRYNRILDRNEITNVASFILTPVFRHITDPYDFLYMERWENGAAMGTGSAQKHSDAFQELLGDWGEVIECPTHSYFVGGLVTPPSANRDEADEAPFQTLSCTLNEGKAIGEAFQAISAWSQAEAATPSGDKNGHAIWLAAAGEDPDADYDFKWNILFPSYEHFGRSFDELWNQGGAGNMFGAIGSVMSCNGGATRTYDQRVIRRME